MPAQLTPSLDQKNSAVGREGPFSQHIFEASQSLRLTPVRQRLKWAGVDLQPGRYTVGSAPDCTIVIDEAGVAPRHCTIIVGERQTILRAWSPRTWVNDGPVQEATLRAGDRLILGPVEIKVEANQPEVLSEKDGPAPEDLLELRSQDLNRKTSLSAGTIPSPRRQQLLEELLQEIQATLGDVIEREKVIRHSLDHEKQRLAQRGDELTHQFQLLESGRSEHLQRLTAAADLSKWQATLDSRHTELAERCAELIRLRRKQKTSLLDLELRESLVTQQKSEFQTREIALRNLAARNDAQKRQLKSRTQDLDRREDVIRMQQAAVNEQQAALESRLASIEEEQDLWLQKCRSRERLLDELDKSIQSRISDIEQEEDRLRRCLSQYEENKQTLLESAAEHETTRQELAARSAVLADQESQLAEETSRINAERLQLEAERNELTAARANFDEQCLLTREQTEAAALSQNELFHSREQALNQREKELLSTEKEFVGREESLRSQLQTLSQQQEELRALEAEVLAKQQALHEREAALENSVHELERRNAEAAATLRQIDDQQAELAAARRQLEQDRTTFLEAQSDWNAQQEIQGRLQLERENERLALEQQKQELKLQFDELYGREASVRAREQQLSEQEAELHRLAASQVTALASVEALNAQAAEAQARTNELEEQLAEVAQARAALDRDIEAFENRQADFDAASQNLSLLRSELEAERQRDAYDREQVTQQRHQLQRALDELEKKRDELAAQELHRLQKQKEWEFEYQSRLAELDRSSLSTEQPNEVVVESEQSRLEREDLQLEIESLQRENETLHTRLSELIAEREEYLFSSKKVSSDEATPVSVFGFTEHAIRNKPDDFGPSAEQSDFIDHRKADQSDVTAVEPPVDACDAQAVQIEKREGQSADAEEEDPAALQLRSQLANLFGFSAEELTESHHHDDQEEVELPTRNELREDRSHSLADSVEDSAPTVSSMVEPTATPAVQSHVVLDENGEETVESYMQRLLARQRGSSYSNASASESRQASPAIDSYSDQGSASELVSDVENQVETHASMRKVRKLNEEEKESIRANVNSFRELANYSTRTAVATSKAERTTSVVRSMFILSTFGWVATAALVIAVLRFDKSFMVEAIFIGGLTALVTLLTLIRCWEVRQIAFVPAPASDLAESPRKSPAPANAQPLRPDENGPLSFL